MRGYSEEVHRFIAENVVGMRSSELSDLVNEKLGTNFTKSKMRSYMKNHNLKNGLPGGLKPGEKLGIYPDDIKEFISKNYVGKGYKTMANLVNNTFETNYTDGQIKGYYARNKLDSGLTGHYHKGHIPYNKGKKKYWVGGEETQFKKGNVPVNHRPVGSERVSVDGYTEIKVAEPNKWKMKHVVIWEEQNGKVPKGSCLIFSDGDKQNLDINNIILISRRQLLVLNSIGLIQKDAELTKTGITIANIKIKMADLKKRA